MWVEFRQLIVGWFGSDKKSATVANPGDFRISEPVLSEAPNVPGLNMQGVGSGNVQIGQNNGTVRVVNLQQESRENSVTHIHVYGESEPGSAKLRTPEQREVLNMIRALRSSESTF